MSALNLRGLVREILDETTEADPGKIAVLVLDHVPDDQLRDALAQVMRLFVRQVISEVRIAPPPHVTPIHAAPSVRSAHSWKGEAIREAWREKKRDRFHVGGGRWKVLDDCTYDDFIAIAEEREKQAEQNQAQGRRYRRFALALKHEEAATFSALSTPTQKRLLEAA